MAIDFTNMEEIQTEDPIDITENNQTVVDTASRGEQINGVDFSSLEEVKEPLFGETEELYPSTNKMIEYKEEEQASKQFQAFASGAATVPLGLLKLSELTVNGIASGSDKYDMDKKQYATFATDLINKNQELKKQLEEELGQTGDILTPYNAGQLVAEMVTAPLAALKGMKGFKWLADAKETTKIAVGEGIAAGTSKAGEGGTALEVGASALLSGITTKVTGGFIEALTSEVKDPSLIKHVISGKSSDKQAYDFLIKKTGETKESTDLIFANYAKAMDKNVEDLTYSDKTIAILNNTEVGKTIKMEAEFLNEGTLAAQNSFEENLQNVLIRATDGQTFDMSANSLLKLEKDAGKIYNDVSIALSDRFPASKYKAKLGANQLSALKESIDNVDRYQSDNPTIKGIIKDLEDMELEGIPIDRLISMNQAVNSLKLKSTKGYTAQEIKNFIDDGIKQATMNETNAYELWKYANKSYRTMKVLSQDNPIGQKSGS